MIITWDEPKRLQNLVKHGLDFAAFEAAFDFGSALVTSSREGRFKLIGLHGGEMLVAVIAAPLGTEAMSLISLRRASKKERQLYGW